ncbi:MAG: YncE family protein [Bacillota bacterium]|nr:YncE family protein [Bacillota bacterium]
MDYLFVCNTGSDSLSRINLKSFREEERIALNNSENKIGPHGLCPWKNGVITANSYSSSISIIEGIGKAAIEEYYIGGNCNGVAVFKGFAFITCGESNNIVVFDLENRRISEEIPGGNLPHSVDVSDKLGLIVITNMENDSISIMDCSNHEIVKNIPVGSYPTKAIFSMDNKSILVCESNLGSDNDGYVNIISMDNFVSYRKIRAGKSPIDIFCGDNMCYAANFSEGCVSFIYLDEMDLVKEIHVGGMPRGIVKKGRFLYVGDNYGNQLVRYDIFNDKKQAIAIGREPTGMTLL